MRAAPTTPPATVLAPEAAGKRPEGGFTLLEAALALAVVGLAVVGATEAASRTLRTQHEVSRHAEALALAEAALDEAVLLERDSLERRRHATVETARLDAGDYRVTTRARPAGEEDRLWELEARVTWGNGELSLGTLVYRPGRSPLGRAGP